MSEISDATEEDIEFLGKLEQRLHYVEEGKFRPNMRGRPYPVKFDSYHDESMAPGEIERVTELVETRADIMMYPINTNMGFSVGFVVSRISAEAPGAQTQELLLLFTEKQLPEGYRWDYLEPVMKGEVNNQKREFMGMPEIKPRHYYDY